MGDYIYKEQRWANSTKPMNHSFSKDIVAKRLSKLVEYSLDPLWYFYSSGSIFFYQKTRYSVANGLFSEKSACYIFIAEREFAEISRSSYYIIHTRFV